MLEVDKLLDMIQRCGGFVGISWSSTFFTAKRKRRERSSAKESDMLRKKNIDVVLSLLPQHVMSANAI